MSYGLNDNLAVSKHSVAVLPLECQFQMPVKTFKPIKSHFAKACKDLEEEVDDEDDENDDSYDE